MTNTYTGFDFLIETLKSKPESSETLSFRISGIDVETWGKLKEDHPDVTASELLKESVRLRHFADAAAREDCGLFFRNQKDNTNINVLELLGLSRARKANAEDAHTKAPAKAPAAATKLSQKTTKKLAPASNVDGDSRSTQSSDKRSHNTVP